MKARGARPAAVVLLVAQILWPGGRPLLAAGWREVSDSWLFDTQTTAVVLDILAEESGEVSARRWEVAVGQGRLFSLAELAQVEVSGQWRGRLSARPWKLQGGWSRLGEGLIQEHRIRWEGSWGQAPGLGVAWETVRWQVAGLEQNSNTRMYLVGTWVQQWRGDRELWVRLRQQVAGQRPVESGESRASFLELGFCGRRAALAVRWDRRPGGIPLVGGDLLWRWVRGMGLSIRWDPATGAFGPGLLVWRGKLLVRTSHIVHPVLGTTHRVGLVVGGGRVP